MNTNNHQSKNISKWMPLWIGSMRQDTIGQPPEFIGMYVNMMMAAWQNGGCIPDDEKQLSRISGASTEQWVEFRQSLANLFVPGNGQWTHNLIREELSKAHRIQSERAAAGRSGAVNRWSKARDSAKVATDLILEKISKDGSAY